MTLEPPPYAVITPARNEAANLRRLGACLGLQTLAPTQWIIVDDGSTDETADVARELADTAAWISTMPCPTTAGRGDPLEAGRRSGRDVLAFTAGVEALREPWEIVVKLDADVSLDPDFFERLIGEFTADPSLGIASGTCYEHEGGRWRPYHVAREHVRGATRAYRRECLRQIGPLERQTGWDAVDEIRAKLADWSTRSLLDLPFYHHRKLGERDGARGQWEAQGQMAHYLDYRLSYLVLRSCWRGLREPAALLMIPSFLAARLRRQPRCADKAVRRRLRAEQSVRMLPLRIRQSLGR
jgi:poly-beta-1,6-N-acetyl-D-glucosamine synthase